METIFLCRQSDRSNVTSQTVDLVLRISLVDLLFTFGTMTTVLRRLHLQAFIRMNLDNKATENGSPNTGRIKRVAHSRNRFRYEVYGTAASHANFRTLAS